MARGNNQYSFDKGISKVPIRFDKNVGGVNFGPTENMVQTFEAANIENLDIDPICGYRKRNGAEALFPPVFADDDEQTGFADHTDREANTDYVRAMFHWLRPGGASYVLFYIDDPGGTSPYTGLAVHGGFDEDAGDYFAMVEAGAVLKGE